MKNIKRLVLPICSMVLFLTINSCGPKYEKRIIHKRASVVYLNGDTDTVEADITLISDRDEGGFFLGKEGCLRTYSNLRHETVCCGVRTFKVID